MHFIILVKVQRDLPIFTDISIKISLISLKMYCLAWFLQNIFDNTSKGDSTEVIMCVASFKNSGGKFSQAVVCVCPLYLQCYDEDVTLLQLATLIYLLFLLTRPWESDTVLCLYNGYDCWAELWIAVVAISPFEVLSDLRNQLGISFASKQEWYCFGWSLMIRQVMWCQDIANIFNLNKSFQLSVG